MHPITPRKKGRPPALTQKQKKFAELYVWDRGKKTLSQCAFEAGYKNRPSETASDLRNPRKYPLVCEYIRKLEKEQENRFRINKSIHMQDLGQIKNKAMEQPTTYSVAQRAEENRGKVMGYYKNENINTNVNVNVDSMTREDLIKEFDKFYNDRMKDITPRKSKPEASESKQDPESD